MFERIKCLLGYHHYVLKYSLYNEISKGRILNKCKDLFQLHHVCVCKICGTIKIIQQDKYKEF
jgi:hypothetical protein